MVRLMGLGEQPQACLYPFDAVCHFTLDSPSSLLVGWMKPSSRQWLT